MKNIILSAMVVLGMQQVSAQLITEKENDRLYFSYYFCIFINVLYRSNITIYPIVYADILKK